MAYGRDAADATADRANTNLWKENGKTRKEGAALRPRNAKVAYICRPSDAQASEMKRDRESLTGDDWCRARKRAPYYAARLVKPDEGKQT